MDAARKVRVKKEEEEEEDKIDSKGRHSHQFTVKFSNEDVKYPIDCDQPRTVLEVIESHLQDKFEKKGYSVSKIIIQRSNKSIVATHFPCSCIENGECLVIHCRTEEVKETKSQHGRILPRKEYSVFYVSKKGGENMKAMKLLKSNPGSKFDYLCVYAKRGTSVKEALERDGRFVNLEDFELSEYEDSNTQILCKQNVDSLDEKKFKICRERKKKTAKCANEQTSNEQQEQPSPSKQSQQKVDTKTVLDEAQKSGISMKATMEEKGSKVYSEEMCKLLCEHLQDLKILTEKGFPDDSYQEALELKKEDFGKIQQSFSEVHRVRELLKLGESVCLLKFNAFQVEVQGTGFLLFDKFILTNAHSFKMCTDLPSDKWGEHVKITATFNYENPKTDSNNKEFTAKLWGGCNTGLDYAILVISQTAETQEAELPEGLLSKFAPPPDNGGACLIGHPAGAVKQIDPTCIIPKRETDPAIKDYIYNLHSIKQEIRKDPYVDISVTYNSFMYDGSSGSPVFDAHGRVFGLHTGNVLLKKSGKSNETTVEYALSLLKTFENFVEELKRIGNNEILARVQEVAKGNPYLEQIIDRLNAG